MDRRHVNQVYQRFIFLKTIFFLETNFLFTILPSQSFNKIEGQGLNYFFITNKPELRIKNTSDKERHTLESNGFLPNTFVFAQYFSTEVCLQPVNGCFSKDTKRIKAKNYLIN